MTVRCKSFQELSTSELFELLHLRSEVFVVEQQCVYQDPDEWDLGAMHLCYYDEVGLAAYARLLPPDTRFPEPSIGRVLTAGRVRKQGFGKMLMQTAIEQCCSEYRPQNIRISAQCYLQRFYTELGFHVCSEAYDEDGIPHVEMIWNADLTKAHE